MRLIDADYLTERLEKLDTMKGIGLEPVMAMRDIKALISVMPTVDAVPVKHGRWIPLLSVSGMYECSVCKDEWGAAAKMVQMKYCPCCGAKMDLEEQQNE